MCSAMHLLYDLAARVQDLIVLDYGQLLNGNGPKWEMKKTSVDRKGLLTDETLELLHRLKETKGGKDSDKIFPVKVGTLKK